MLSTDKQTDKLTNATKNITSFAKEETKYVTTTINIKIIFASMDNLTSDHAFTWIVVFWFKYYLGHVNQTPQVQPNQGSNSWPPDHDSTFYITEMTALTTWSSVSSIYMPI